MFRGEVTFALVPNTSGGAPNHIEIRVRDKKKLLTNTPRNIVVSPEVLIRMTAAIRKCSLYGKFEERKVRD